jgi:toxin YoeB
MKITFYDDAVFETFHEWASIDKKIFDKLVKLIRDIERTPYTGLGKPELLKYQYSGCWSRRITDEHRLVYKVEADAIVILSCKSHY